MRIEVQTGKPQETTADTLILGVFAGEETVPGAAGEIDATLGGWITELIAGGEVTGKAGEVSVLYPRGALAVRRLLVTGLGKRDGFDAEAARRAAGVAMKRARDLKARQVAFALPEEGTVESIAQASAEGAHLALYQFAADKADEEKKGEVESLTLLLPGAAHQAEAETGVRAAQAIAEAVSLARDLVNMPPNVATPTRLAAAAQQIATAGGLKLTVGERDWAAERGMGAYLGVAKGAGEPPKFIILEHNGDRQDLDTIVLVGKGITFDTGGISIKPADKMGEMKSDMAGAAAVLGAMQAVARLDLPLRVIGIAPCTENMPDAAAYRPADVLTASNGKTIEIISTDAEGRLILADALVHAGQYAPKAVIDLATLTGACVVALGDNIAAGLFTTDDWLRDRLVSSGAATHERLWPLPLWDDYKKALKSDVADLKNSGGRFGGVGTSAIFLREFTSYPWAHVDMAGMALNSKDSPYEPAGATGFGVRLLVDFLRNWSGS